MVVYFNLYDEWTFLLCCVACGWGATQWCGPGPGRHFLCGCLCGGPGLQLQQRKCVELSLARPPHSSTLGLHHQLSHTHSRQNGFIYLISCLQYCLFH